MSAEEQQGIKKLNGLQKAFGSSIELIAEDGTADYYDIKAEFQLGDIVYAALQSEAMRREDEVELFRVTYSGDEPQLETIEDDEEWESASEAYDDLWFAEDERP